MKGKSNLLLISTIVLVVGALLLGSGISGMASTGTGTVNVTISSVTDIEMVTSTCNFGSLATSAIANTSNGDGTPHEIRNEGNVNITVTIDSTPQLFSSATNANNFKFMCNITGEIDQCAGSSVTSLTAVPVASPATVIDDMSFESAEDQLEVEFWITVPSEEPPAPRNATITYSASAA